MQPLRVVQKLKKEQPERYAGHPKAKLLKRILELILNEIPRNPNSVEYQLGNTLGPAHRHWRRAKFLGRFRLFYRFSTAHRAIVYAWVNDETTLRKADSRTDRTRSSTSDCARAILPTIRTTYSGKRNRASAELRLPLFWSLLNIGQQLASMRLGF
jgi:hypothetical protein